MLLIGGAVAAAAGVGYLIYMANQPKTTPLLPGGVVAGAVQTVLLAPGTLTPVKLATANAGAISIVAPLGGTLGTVSFNPPLAGSANAVPGTAVSMLAPPSNGAMYVWVANGPGTTTVTATYTDSGGILQTSTFTVTVT
jgi:hypothetical protein